MQDIPHLLRKFLRDPRIQRLLPRLFSGKRSARSLSQKNSFKVRRPLAEPRPL